MNGRELAFSLQEILDEYRILEDTPLREIVLVTAKDGALLFNPSVEIQMRNGTIFELNIIQKSTETVLH